MCMQVASQAEASGKLVLQPSLADIQGQKFDAPTIILANQVGGMEDIPVRLLPFHRQGHLLCLSPIHGSQHG